MQSSKSWKFGLLTVLFNFNLFIYILNADGTKDYGVKDSFLSFLPCHPVFRGFYCYLPLVCLSRAA